MHIIVRILLSYKLNPILPTKKELVLFVEMAWVKKFNGGELLKNDIDCHEDL